MADARVYNGFYMRYGIFSDVHGNLEAFKAVLEAFGTEDMDKYIFLGDIVGYGADPAECIRLLRPLNAVMVAGNHDWAAAGLFDKNWFNKDAKDAITWTESVSCREDKEFLKAMPLVQHIKNIGITHGSFDKPSMFEYVTGLSAARICLKKAAKPICFTGHTHIPAIFLMKGSHLDYTIENQFYIQEDVKYLINAGSVGQPRDANPHACYCIYDSKKRFFQIKRLPY